MAEGTVPPVSRKRRGDFVGDVQRWSEQSWYTRMWSPSPAGGPHPLKVPSAVWKLCLLAIGVGILFTVADALLHWVQGRVQVFREDEEGDVCRDASVAPQRIRATRCAIQAVRNESATRTRSVTGMSPSPTTQTIVPPMTTVTEPSAPPIDFAGSIKAAGCP